MGPHSTSQQDESIEPNTPSILPEKVTITRRAKKVDLEASAKRAEASLSTSDEAQSSQAFDKMNSKQEKQLLPPPVHIVSLPHTPVRRTKEIKEIPVEKPKISQDNVEDFASKIKEPLREIRHERRETKKEAVREERQESREISNETPREARHEPRELHKENLREVRHEPRESHRENLREVRHEPRDNNHRQRSQQNQSAPQNHNDFRKRDRNHREVRQNNHHPQRHRERFLDMHDDDNGDNLIIEMDLNDPRVVRISELQRMNVEQLIHFAKTVGVELSSSGLAKSQIVFEVVRTLCQASDEIIVGEGTLEVLPDGYGFLRSPIYNYLPSVEDIYISPTQVRRLDLRKGDTIVGTIRSPKEKEKYFALAKVEGINGCAPALVKERTLFENLTPLYPQERLVMETDKANLTTRVIDLAAPIGKGQRGIIVAPPRSGKTIILQQIAGSISTNNPDAKLIVLLIDERPEEVTDMMRTVKGEVVASTFDEPPERHVQVADMVIEKARRMVECGLDVIILLDSLTRLARAYNTVQPHSGKILSGGIDANALHKPKRFFGAARNIEKGGSLTIIATALVETGSRMDEVIFEEFKGTGNMEIVLDRRLADRRTWPAIDLIRSGTRKEDLLFHPHELERIYRFREAIADLSSIDAMNLLTSRLKKTSSNIEFLLSLKD
jgi:transcription termination factor Rho